MMNDVEVSDIMKEETALPAKERSVHSSSRAAGETPLCITRVSYIEDSFKGLSRLTGGAVVRKIWCSVM